MIELSHSEAHIPIIVAAGSIYIYPMIELSRLVYASLIKISPGISTHDGVVSFGIFTHDRFISPGSINNYLKQYLRGKFKQFYNYHAKP